MRFISCNETTCWTIRITEHGVQYRQGLYAGNAGKEMAEINARLIMAASPITTAKVEAA